MSSGWRKNGAIRTKLKSPCHNCENRKIGCHGSCDKYKEYRQKYDALNEKEKKDKMVTHGADHISRISFNNQIKF